MLSTPNIDVLPGACATVKVIDNNSRLGNISTDVGVGPPVPGFDRFPAFPSFSFLIENPQGRKVLYDLAIRPDWHSLPPDTVKRLESTPWQISADRHVVDILKDHGVDGSDIEAIVWSHWHWDHTGAPSTFPTTTDLVVGPGFKKAFFPGYPARKDSPILESDYKGRRLIEIDFSKSCLHIGQMHAHDYFGDGSFYILDAPGHAVGHVCALVRTTSPPDTFVFLAGDAIHHAAELRPSNYLPIPSSISPHPLRHLGLAGSFCPGHILDDLQSSRGLEPGQPFFNPLLGLSIPDVISTIHKVQELDCNGNIFVIFSHDTHMPELIDFFPKEINHWKEKGWGQVGKWSFLQDFEKYILSAMDCNES